MSKSLLIEFLKTSQFNQRRISTINWLCSHIDRQTGKPFLTEENQCAAQRFSLLCEKLSGQYRLTNWHGYVDIGHTKEMLPYVGNARKIFVNALKALGKDALLAADIILRNYPLSEAEKKYQLRKGRAKKVLKQALDRLGELFGLQVHSSR